MLKNAFFSEMSRKEKKVFEKIVGFFKIISLQNILFFL